jgi:glutamate synthase domain-containing protein 2
MAKVGEIPDIMGAYKESVGQQVASARFGVNFHLLNRAPTSFEIKIGSGCEAG